MDQPTPANAEAVFDEKRWRTEGSILIAYSAWKSPTDDNVASNFFIFITKKGNYFSQQDDYSPVLPVHSHIKPMTMSSAIEFYERENFIKMLSFSEAFGKGLEDA